MAGYIIYSLDAGKFESFVNKPTRKQLQAFAERISDGLDENDGQFEDGDPVHEWPSEPDELCDLVKERLARPDWYGDLSDVGKMIWSEAVWGFCCRAKPKEVGIRVDHDGVYWDVIRLAWKGLKVPPNQVLPQVALSAFGALPYRFLPADAPKGFDDFHPMHSMHTPDEVHKMLEELRSVAPLIESSENEQAIEDYDSLIPVLEELDKEKRMLFIQVDT